MKPSSPSKSNVKPEPSLAGIVGVDASALSRRIGLAALVGIVAGLLAVMFHVLIAVLSDLLLGDIGGFNPGGPAHETFEPESEHAPALMHLRPWAWVLLPLAGGLLNGWLIQRYELMAGGHGTGAAIRAFHQGLRLRRRLIPAKMLTSAITLGTGGSGGREGPIAEIGAAAGYWVGETFGLSAIERRRLLLAGMGAGVGAIFHAPLAGAIFAIEVLYREPDFEAEALIPAFLASVIAYSVFSFAFGIGSFEPLFAVETLKLTVDSPIALLPALTVLALTMALASWVFTRMYATVETRFSKLPIPAWTRPGLGGLMVGLVAVTAFYGMGLLNKDASIHTLSVMSTGYGLLQGLLDESIFQTTSTRVLLIVLLVVGLGKMLTTSLTSGSGGSGGVFGPSMVIGGALGGVVGLLLKSQFPDSFDDSTVLIFVILGMASFFSAAASTPVSTLIMVSELTNGYALLLPAMWVCALSYLASSRWSIYREQVTNRRASAAHRGDFVVDVLQGLTVRDALSDSHKRFTAVPMSTPLDEIGRLVTSTTHGAFPVLDSDGKYYGLFSLNDIRQFLYESGLGPLAIAQDLATEDVPPIPPTMSLTNAISRFATSRFDELPVADEAEPDVIIAMLRRHDLLTLYSQTLMKLRDTESADLQNKL